MVDLRSTPNNTAFQKAFQKHVDNLEPIERESFHKAYETVTPEDLLSKVKAYDEKYNDQAVSKNCAGRITKVLSVVEQLMRGVSIGIQHSPEISSLVVGAVRLIIDVRRHSTCALSPFIFPEILKDFWSIFQSVLEDDCKSPIEQVLPEV